MEATVKNPILGVEGASVLEGFLPLIQKRKTEELSYLIVYRSKSRPSVVSVPCTLIYPVDCKTSLLWPVYHPLWIWNTKSIVCKFTWFGFEENGSWSSFQHIPSSFVVCPLHYGYCPLTLRSGSVNLSSKVTFCGYWSLTLVSSTNHCTPDPESSVVPRMEYNLFRRRKVFWTFLRYPSFPIILDSIRTSVCVYDSVWLSLVWGEGVPTKRNVRTKANLSLWLRTSLDARVSST